MHNLENDSIFIVSQTALYELGFLGFLYYIGKREILLGAIVPYFPNGRDFILRRTILWWMESSYTFWPPNFENELGRFSVGLKDW